MFVSHVCGRRLLLALANAYGAPFFRRPLLVRLFFGAADDVLCLFWLSPDRRREVVKYKSIETLKLATRGVFEEEDKSCREARRGFSRRQRAACDFRKAATFAEQTRRVGFSPRCDQQCCSSRPRRRGLTFICFPHLLLSPSVCLLFPDQERGDDRETRAASDTHGSRHRTCAGNRSFLSADVSAG